MAADEHAFDIDGQVYETSHIKVKGQWKYLYRAVDRDGQTLDFLHTARRDKQAARRFFKKAVRQHGLPDTVTIDKSGANTAALAALIEETEATIEIRQSKCLGDFRERLSPKRDRSMVSDTFKSPPYEGGD